MKENFKKQSGITLIALIITIIVMLILVAVTVRVVVNSGLFKHAGNASGGYDMQQARERLETTLASAQAEKYTNPLYNQNTYLDSLIVKELPEVNITEDIVILDGWAFELDRSVPKIDQDLGKEGSYTFPTIISTNVEVSGDTKSATITVVAEETEHGITKMELYKDGNMVGTAVDCGGSKTPVTKTFTVTEGGNYTVKVYSEYSKSVSVNVTGIAELTTDRSSLQVGDYVNYTPDTASAYSLTTGVSGYSSNQSIAQDTTLKWQVMNINADGSVDLISSAPISKTVYFQGALGYNNGVYVLNNLCKEQYSNTSLGAVARSIDLEDIEPKFNGSGIAARDAFISHGGNIKYGETQTYVASASYSPDIYDHVEKTTAGESIDYYSAPTDKTYSQKGTLEVKHTYYQFDSTPTSYMDDQEFYELIFGTSTAYWLASREANCYPGRVYLGLRLVDSATLKGDALFCPYDRIYIYNYYYRVRPVVTLRSNVKISTAGGTEDSPRDISL